MTDRTPAVMLDPLGGAPGQVPTINAAGTAVEYADLPSGGSGGSSGSGWALSIDNALTSLTGLTAHSGTWALGGVGLRQTDTAAAHRRLSVQQLAPIAHCVAQVDVKIISGGTFRAAGIVVGTDSTGSNGRYALRIEGDGTGPTAVTLEREEVATILSVAQDWGSYDEWHTLRLVVAGSLASVFLDGTLLGTGRIGGAEGNWSRVGLKTFGCLAEFRNLKVWTPTAPTEGTAGTAVFGVPAPTGVAATDTANILAAVTDADSVGGGWVELKVSPLGNVPYELSQPLPLKPGVKYRGVRPTFKQVLNGVGVWLADGEGNFEGGTILHGNGTFACFEANTTPATTPPTDYGQYEIPATAVLNIGIDNFTYGVHAGAQNVIGLTWGEIDGLFIKNCSQWGVNLVNFAHMTIGTIQTSLCQNGQRYATDLDADVFQPANSTWVDVYNIIPRDGRNARLCRGIVLESRTPSGTTSSLGQLDFRRVQVNGFNRTKLSVTATFTNASTTVSVPDGTQFLPGMLVQFTTSGKGFTAGTAYVVKTVTGNTLTLGSSYNTAAIAATASGTLTMETYGFANIEIIGRGSTTALVQSTHIGTLDSEGTTSAALFVENASQLSIDTFGGLPEDTLVDIVGRNMARSEINCTVEASTDFDAASATSLYNGFRNTTYGYPLRGHTYDPTSNTYGINIWAGESGQSGQQIQARVGGFLYPSSGIGERVMAQNASQTLVPQWSGNLVFTGTTAQTYTLPTIVASNPGDSTLGMSYTLTNLGTADLAVAAGGGQSFNENGALTSLVIPPAHRCKVVAAQVASGDLTWIASRVEPVQKPATPEVVVPPASMWLDSATQPWYAANYPTVHRFTLHKTTTLRYVNLRIGVASGNIQVGVIRLGGATGSGNLLDWVRVMHSGVIACPAAGNQRIDCGATTLPPGEYGLFFWTDNTTIEVPHTLGTLALAAARVSLDMGTLAGGFGANGTAPGWSNRTVAGLTVET